MSVSMVFQSESVGPFSAGCGDMSRVRGGGLGDGGREEEEWLESSAC